MGEMSELKIKKGRADEVEEWAVKRGGGKGRQTRRRK